MFRSTAQVAAGHVRFLHDGGEAAPTFSIKANDGLADSNSVSGSVTFTNVNDAPVLNSVAFSVSEGNAAVLSAANISLTDPDSSAFTYTVSSVSHGVFQTSADGSAWTDATSFTTAQVAASHVRFLHDGGEAAPSFSIKANDGLADSNSVSGQVIFTNVNDAPVLNSVAFSVSEGNAAVLSAANIRDRKSGV